mmetsp:Transcript_82695/g.192136  ORF Transcript_82695/g.192136 Transcript_82695/m.192136 type:complete len:240 (-) Transcript_82695:478-1197(-)
MPGGVFFVIPIPQYILPTRRVTRLLANGQHQQEASTFSQWADDRHGVGWAWQFPLPQDLAVTKPDGKDIARHVRTASVAGTVQAAVDRHRVSNPVGPNVHRAICPTTRGATRLPHQGAALEAQTVESAFNILEKHSRLLHAVAVRWQEVPSKIPHPWLNFELPELLAIRCIEPSHPSVASDHVWVPDLPCGYHHTPVCVNATCVPANSFMLGWNTLVDLSYPQLFPRFHACSPDETVDG